MKIIEILEYLSKLPDDYPISAVRKYATSALALARKGVLVIPESYIIEGILFCSPSCRFNPVKGFCIEGWNQNLKKWPGPQCPAYRKEEDNK